MASTRPHCNARKQFFFEGGVGFKAKDQIGTCTCGAIIKAKNGSTVVFKE